MTILKEFHQGTTTILCQHCKSHFVPYYVSHTYKEPNLPSYAVLSTRCANSKCSKISIFLVDLQTKKNTLVYPIAPTHCLSVPEVPLPYKKDFDEACLIQQNSPNASAALARRCLQNILRNHLNIKIPNNNLYNEIEEAKNKRFFSPTINDRLDDIRNYGNWAAHPELSNSNIVIDVDPDEAEWSLEVLELIFQQLFVDEAKAQKMKSKIAQKKSGKAKP